ncbi:MAG: hypothetical protein GYB51_00080 [Rhodobacteraceae bacterium]|nr:hypothetical protein [Paracoccaceae bacterium]
MAAEVDFAGFMMILRARYLESDAVDFDTCFQGAAEFAAACRFEIPGKPAAKLSLIGVLREEDARLRAARIRLGAEIDTDRFAQFFGEEQVAERRDETSGPFGTIRGPEGVTGMRSTVARISARHETTKLPIRQYARICIPGRIISQAGEALLRPMLLAGPELAKFLEPRVARIADMSCPSRWQRWLRDAGQWLLEEPDSELGPKAGSIPSFPGSPDDDHALQDLHRGKRKWTSEGIAGQGEASPTPRFQGPQEGQIDPQTPSGRGVR